ncbi:1,4-dihydroxy-2-naphthoate octaprenyltransferase [Klebsiella pneumoniae]|uniref:1,4-dihydroxy-2-naphthoate octaprenyltransferase n=1 Tax=Klebsiella pneumoniae TaxID=573 RepID=A0A377ZT63_KLEPN|nr:1,4-dihydroxy-2-naphthoate octaprenyltransferase [Klebsiella pneumoniae]
MVWVISQYRFLGWLSVLGSWYLQAHNVKRPFSAATACGLLATAVLTSIICAISTGPAEREEPLAVRLGPVNARRYHAACARALLCLALFNLLALHSAWGWLFFLATPLLVKQARTSCANPIRWRCGQCSKRRSKGPY